MASVIEPEHKLNFARRAAAGGIGVIGTLNEPEVGGRQTYDRRTVLRPIEDVERFGAEADGHALTERDLLFERRIELPDARCADKIATRVAPGSRGGE